MRPENSGAFPTHKNQPNNSTSKIIQLTQSTRAYILVAFVVIGAVWLATIQTVQSERQGRLDYGQERAQELTRIFEAHALNVIGYADTYVKAARQVYMRNGSLADVQQFLADVPPNHEILSHITLINATGKPVFISTGDMLDPNVTTVDRDYFKFQKATPGDQMFVSKINRGRNSGLLTIRIVRQIEMVPGQFGGVIFAAIQVRKITEPFQALELGPNGTVGLIGLDRQIRTWFEYGNINPDRDVRTSAIWAAAATEPIGMVSETSAVSGVTLDVAYRKLPDYPLIASIGIAGSDMIQATSRYTWSAISIAALVTLVVIMLTSSLLRDARMLRVLEKEVAVRRRAEAEAVHATQIKTTFLTTMSHEVRTPINAILGLFELIEQADIPARQKRQARAGQTAAGDLFKQLTNVLDASRLEAKSLDINLRDEPLRPIIADLSELLEAAIKTSGKSLKATCKIDANVPELLRMDRRRVEQIVLNFIDNAVKFSTSGKVDLSVSLETSGPDDMVKISVCDTGPGIREVDMERIFKRFSQLDEGVTRRAGGTGLGLSISQDLADLMHTRLEVESIEGNGSCFSLFLPLDWQNGAQA